MGAGPLAAHVQTAHDLLVQLKVVEAESSRIFKFDQKNEMNLGPVCVCVWGGCCPRSYAGLSWTGVHGHCRRIVASLTSTALRKAIDAGLRGRRQGQVRVQSRTCWAASGRRAPGAADRDSPEILLS